MLVFGKIINFMAWEYMKSQPTKSNMQDSFKTIHSVASDIMHSKMEKYILVNLKLISSMESEFIVMKVNFEFNLF